MGYMNARTSSAVVFQYFVSLTTIFAVLNWMCVLLSYIAFRRALKAQNFNFDDLPYRAMGQPWGAYYALLITLAVCLFSGMYLSPPSQLRGVGAADVINY